MAEPLSKLESALVEIVKISGKSWTLDALYSRCDYADTKAECASALHRLVTYGLLVRIGGNYYLAGQNVTPLPTAKTNTQGSGGEGSPGAGGNGNGQGQRKALAAPVKPKQADRKTAHQSDVETSVKAVTSGVFGVDIDKHTPKRPPVVVDDDEIVAVEFVYRDGRRVSLLVTSMDTRTAQIGGR